MPFLFHQVPEQLFGDTLYPLSSLRNVNRRLYLREHKKYRGREHVVLTAVPPLNCMWSDVVFLTAVHPCTWRRTFTEVGIEVERLRYYAIEVSEIDTANLCVLWYDEYGRDSFRPFSLLDIGKYAEIPEQAIACYRYALAAREPVFWHHLVPQILHKGTIDVSKPTIVEA